MGVLTDGAFLSAFLLIFVCIVAGYLLRRKKAVSDGGKNAVTAVIWKLALPCMAFSAFVRDFSAEELSVGAAVLIGSSVLYLAFVGVGFLVFRRCGRDKARVAALLSAIGQVTLFAMPLTKALGLERATLYCGLMAIPFRLVLYFVAYPMLVVSGESKKARIKSVFLNPVIIAMVLGFLVWLGQGILPAVRIDKTVPAVYSVINTLSDLVCPLAMLLTGMILGEASIADAFRDKKAWIAALMRTVAFPAVVFLAAWLLPVFDSDAVLALTLGFAAPASVTLCAFSSIGKIEETFSARIVALSAVLCVATVPLFTWLAMTATG